MKDFYNLPSEFNADGLAEIKSALQEFHDYRAYVIGMIDELGGDYGFKNPSTYDDVYAEIKWRKFPAEPEKKLLAVLEKMREVNCRD